MKVKISKMEWLTFFIALAGALAWFQPIISNSLKRHNIYCKVLGIYSNSGPKGKALMLFKLSVYSENDKLQIDDVGIKIKFDNTTTYIVGNTLVLTNIIFEIEKKNQKLLVPQDQFFNNIILIPKDELKVGYLLVSIPYENEYGDVEKVSFTFSQPGKKKDKSYLVTNLKEMVKSNKISLDPSIWKELSNEEANQYLSSGNWNNF